MNPTQGIYVWWSQDTLYFYQLYDKVIKGRPLQAYFYDYLIHISSTITIKSVVSGTANKFIRTPLYNRLSVSLQLAHKSFSQELSLQTPLGLAPWPPPWPNINSSPIDIYRNFKGYIVYRKSKRQNKHNLSQKQASSHSAKTQSMYANELLMLKVQKFTLSSQCKFAFAYLSAEYIPDLVSNQADR